CDDRDDRFRAGADVLNTEAKFNAAIGIDLGFALSGIAAAAGTPRRAGATDAGFHHAGRAARFPVFRLPAELFRADGVFALADFVRIIFQAELQRVHAE